VTSHFIARQSASGADLWRPPHQNQDSLPSPAGEPEAARVAGQSQPPVRSDHLAAEGRIGDHGPEADQEILFRHRRNGGGLFMVPTGGQKPPSRAGKASVLKPEAAPIRITLQLRTLRGWSLHPCSGVVCSSNGVQYARTSI